MLEELREELYRTLESCNYDLLNPAVIKASQRLDKELNKKRAAKAAK